LNLRDGLKYDEIPEVVVEENDLLKRVQNHIRRGRSRREIGIDYDQELISLRDAIAEAKPEDVPPLVEQMTRLQSLAAQRGLGEDVPVDPECPYFGHLRLKEENEQRDVMLGKHTYLSPEDGVRIVDWRNAPVSRIYYSYDVGDEYEEEFGGKLRQGTVASRRSVTIIDGGIKRIAEADRIYSLRRGQWQVLDPESSTLAGGQGISIRAEGLKTSGVLGVDADGTDRKDKHLPEIAALLDKAQFDLISSPASDLLVVKGGAGSGKTTVGLHRIAYLNFLDPRKFRANRMLVVVLNTALASYISRVLPALGVQGVRAMTFTEWARNQRRRHIKGIRALIHADTPQVVSRFKRHPAILRILDDWVDRFDEEMTHRLARAVAKTPDGERVMAAWRSKNRVPVHVRRSILAKWLSGGMMLSGVSRSDLAAQTVAAAESVLLKMERETGDILSSWADLFTDRTVLSELVDAYAPAEFTDNDIREIHEWCVGIYNGLTVHSEEEEKGSAAAIDAEDEAIFLRLYQLKIGWLKGPGGRLAYDHLMLDEVQDFSHVEVAVLMETIAKGRPVTLAGDAQQKIDWDSGFVSWQELLRDLGVKESRIVPLQVAYRSTAEIMRLSREVLGPLAEEAATPSRRGAPIELHRFSDTGQAVGFLGEALRDLARREPLANVAVVARYPSQATLYYAGLKKSEVPRLNLVSDQDFSFAAGVEVTDIRQVKGLEFDYVILVEVNADAYPDDDESRHMFHVGATRAAHQLWVVVTQKPSPILPKWLLEEDEE
jgi:DNA helicase II / ATP-dependent DNA helicase PcrA